MSQVISFADYTPAARFDDVAWTQAQIEEGSTSDGPWTVIDTITLDPVDVDPADPQTRNVTTGQASDTSGLWYRLTFLDDNGDHGQPSAAVQNAAPSTTQFASSAEFAARLGIDLTSAETVRADTLLALASEIIQKETGQTISLVTDDDLVRPSVSGDRFRLPQRPVVEVTEILLNGVEVSSDSWYVDGDEVVRAFFSGVVSERTFGTAGGWLGPLRTLTVTYTHGYAEIPAVVKGVCMEMVARCFTNPGAVIQESIGNEATTYAPYSAPATGLLMTDAEKRAVNDVLRRTSGSVTLR